jgi:cell division protein FtsW
MTFTRADRSLIAEWWFTVDRVLLGAVFILIAAGVVLSLAASPAVAVRKGLPAFYFAERHAAFAALGVLLMLAISLLTPRQIRRLAGVLFFVSIGLMIWLAAAGPEINGARRWVRLAGHSFQPSEFAKPGFVVLSAWLFAEARHRKDMPAVAIGVALFALFTGLLLIQPDVGQTLLVVLVWGALLVLSGQPLRYAAILAGGGLAMLGAAYVMFDHVRSRIGRFIDPSSGDTFQTDRAIQSFSEGGFLGRGPGEGTIKSVLPDAHTDFIFAVIGEEYGVLACLVLLGLFAFVVWRALTHIWREPDLFKRLGVVGLALLFAFQASINMSVNVGLLPAKGMTLPFISSGGSSNLAVSIAVGMMLGLMRRRPNAGHVKKPQLQPSLGRVGV